MPTNLNVNLTDLIKRARLRDVLEAEKRLNSRFGQEEDFGEMMKPEAQDLVDYETVSGTAWPKRSMTLNELQQMQQDIGGGDAAVNVPTEAIAEPVSRSDRKMVDAIAAQNAADVAANMKSEAEAAQWPAKYRRLANYLGDSYSRDDVLANMGFKRAADGSGGDTWSDPYEGPGGSLLQRNSRGKVASVLGRESGGGKDGEEERMKAEKWFRNLALRQYGATEFSALDPSLNDKVNRVSQMATDNYFSDPKRQSNLAFNKAFSAVENSQILSKLPAPDRGRVFNNYEQTRTAIRKAIAAGVSPDEVGRAMLAKGWTLEEMKELAGVSASGASSSGSGASSAGGTDDSDLKRRYFELRRKGMSAEAAGRELGIQ